MGSRVQGQAQALVEERLAALRALAVPILQSGIAASLAWYVAHGLVGHPKAFFAPIAALVALGVGVANRPRRVVELSFGVAVGIGVGDALVSWIGHGTWQIGLCVLIAMTSAVLIGGGPLFIAQAATSSILVATLVGAHNVSRFVDALIGGAVGLAVLVAVPANPLRQAQRLGAALFAELAATLDDIAAAVEARDVAAVRESLARARAAEGLIGEWREALTIGRETARLSPHHWRNRTKMVEYAVAGEQMELAVRNTRVLARAATRAVELDPNLPPELPAAIRQLAQAVRMVEPALESRDRSEAIAAAVGAARTATEALERDPDLTAAHVVGQIRSASADLLRALGLERGDAVERVRAAAAQV